MKKKLRSNGLNLGPYYFDKLSGDLVIQSVWMMDLWLELADEYYLQNEIEWELTNEKYQNRKKHVSKKWEEEIKKHQKKVWQNYQN